MRLVRANFVSIAALALLGCSSEPTALVIEVGSALSSGEIDSVSFHVTGPGLESSGRSAQVPLAGADARSFPLRLTLVHGGAAMGPLVPTIEGQRQGQLRARVPAPPALYFQPGRTVTHHFVLRALDAPAPVATTPAPAPPPDAATPGPDAAKPSPPPPSPQPSPPPSPKPDAAAPSPAPDAAKPPPSPPPMPPPMTCPSKCASCGDDKDCRKECKKLGCCSKKCEGDDDDG